MLSSRQLVAVPFLQRALFVRRWPGLGSHRTLAKGGRPERACARAAEARAADSRAEMGRKKRHASSAAPTERRGPLESTDDCPAGQRPPLISPDASTYDAQLAAKKAKVLSMFASLHMPELEVFPSRPLHHRMRCELRVWHEGDTMDYVMFSLNSTDDFLADPGARSDGGEDSGDDRGSGEGDDGGEEEASGATADGNGAEGAAATEGAAAEGAVARGSNGAGTSSWEWEGRKRKRRREKGPRPRPTLFWVRDFPVVSELANAVLARVRDECNTGPYGAVLRRKLFQVNVHTTLSGDAMCTLVYHCKIEDSWIEAAKHLKESLSGLPGVRPGGQVSVIGRSRRQRVLFGDDYVTEEFEVDGKAYKYRQMEEAFSQPNAYTCRHMLHWARSCTAGSRGSSLLELYCGNANLSIPVAEHFDRVIGTEIARRSVQAAQWNIEANAASNVAVAPMAAEAFTAALRAKEPLPKLGIQAAADWDALNVSTLMVDPPRAGLDDATRALLRDFDRTVYISCNPRTLLRDIEGVAGPGGTHRVARFALFDQFPYCDHCEMGVMLERVK